MRSRPKSTLFNNSVKFAIAILLVRRVSCLDLRLDIAGGGCYNNTDFDDTFDNGIMPGTSEVMDISTQTLDEDAVREYGYSAFRGDHIDDVDFQFHEELQDYLQDALEEHEDPGKRRDLQLFDCPVFRECPGAGDPTHWCAWICGYWQQQHDSPNTDSGSSQRKDNGFLRRVTEDLRIPDAELQQLDRHPIRYTPQDRQLWVSIEGLVCGWIQRWLDSELSDCLHGATLTSCELDLAS